MTSVGFDKPLYILPFDHRGSFQTQMFGWKGTISPEQRRRSLHKRQIYDGFKVGHCRRSSQDKGGIW